MKNYSNIYIVVLIVVSQLLNAQKKDENIGTEVVNVVKAYTPTVSDAFKVKETPTLDDNETAEKKEIKYTIFSFPVASTFTPAKGKAAGVEKAAPEKSFNNYAYLGAGNYGNINAELFLSSALENNNYIAAMVHYLSSQGGIKNVPLSNKFYDTALDLTYGNKSKNSSWNADLGYQNQTNHWYGIQPDLFDETTIAAINPKQNYQTIYLGGQLALSESVFKNASVKFSHFSDKFSSSENRFVAKPSFEFDIENSKIKTNFIVDYLSGSFKKTYFDTDGFTYGYANFGMQPSYQYLKDDLSVNIGVSAYYSAATSGGTNKFFLYPNVTASFKVVGDLMIAYGGAEGGLNQNTYHDFVQNNFFISPTLAISPTDQKYNVYAGLKGKLACSVGYNIKASFINEANKALYKNNGYSFFNTNTNGYAYGNSFDVVYDNVKTVSFYGELKADFSKKFSFGINGTFNSYTTDKQSTAWNLPNLKIGSNLDFVITPKWFAGLNVFFVGQRKDQFVLDGLSPSTTDITLNNYFDLNANVGYKHNDRWTFYLKGNNLANQNYQKWVNYPVQGIQGVLGASYKFDF